MGGCRVGGGVVRLGRQGGKATNAAAAPSPAAFPRARSRSAALPCPGAVGGSGGSGPIVGNASTHPAGRKFNQRGAERHFRPLGLPPASPGGVYTAIWPPLRGATGAVACGALWSGHLRLERWTG